MLREDLSGVNAVSEGNTVVMMRQRLQTLQPARVEIYDESGEHVGHEGARAGGGHYQLLIVSDEFAGKAALARHRMVYAAVGEMMRGQIHALAVQAYTVDEFERAFHG